MTDTHQSQGGHQPSGEPGDERLVTCERIDIPGGNGVAALLTLNRPDQLNAITWPAIDAFDAAVTEAMEWKDTRAILVTGSGRAFSAGGDLKAYQVLQKDAARFPAFVDSLHATFGRLRHLRVPVIALVNGITAAGGLELLLNCDIGLAAESARIGDAHLNFGQMGGGGVLTLLPRYVGIAKATELILTGKFLTAQDAADWGLINAVVPDAALLEAGLDLAAEISRKSPLAVANAKYVLTSVWSESLAVSAGLRLERERNSLYCLTSFDAPEGLAAFAEKREPNFEGR
jgi:enoyl-CoA hydratase/carnithine racemase